MLGEKDSYVVAVVGGTGAVGNEMVTVLEEREFPVERLRIFASENFEGETLTFEGSDIAVETLKENSFEGVDIVMFATGAACSKAWAPIAVRLGCIVIDSSSQWRMDPEVPLVIPEVNPHDLLWHKGIIANPSSSTIQLAVTLKPIHDAGRIRRVVVTAFQSVSATGKKAMDELFEQTKDLLSFKDVKNTVYPHQIAFNLLPHVGGFMPNGYTREEMRLLSETRKMLGDYAIQLTATAVRVPVFLGHSQTVNIETVKKLTAVEARDLLLQAPGIVVFDVPEKNVYPLPLQAAGKNEVYVGRIREDESIPNGLNLWTVVDNLRKGAALNAVQIAEALVGQ